jgi:hypothetical protein
VDGQRLGVVRADANGTFALETALPADVAVGEVDVRAQVALEGRAIARTAATTTLRVQATPTELSVNATGIDAYRVVVTGRLRTADGRPVANQPVALVANGTVLQTVSTDAAGQFDGGLIMPDGLTAANGTVTVRLAAAFDGAGTNLEGSRATARVQLVPPANETGSEGQNQAGGGVDPDGGPGSSTVDGWLPFGLWPALGVVLAVVVVGVVGVVVVRRRRSTDESDTVADEAATAASADPGIATGTADPGESAPAPIEAATDRLAAGDPDGAVELAYLGLRGELEATLAIDGARTHWEFLEACGRTGLDEERLATLETLTETYEQAAFAPTAVDAERAREAISHAGSVTVDGE